MPGLTLKLLDVEFLIASVSPLLYKLKLLDVEFPNTYPTSAHRENIEDVELNARAVSEHATARNKKRTARAAYATIFLFARWVPLIIVGYTTCRPFPDRR